MGQRYNATNKDSKINKNKIYPKTYKIWSGMRSRCNSKYNDKKQYKDYAGRGIKVCDRWLHSFENFLADMGERPEGKTLDRIDNNGNYEPNNCRWATNIEQKNNTSKNVYVAHDDCIKSIAEWARELGMKYNSFKYCVQKKYKNSENIILDIKKELMRSKIRTN